MTKTLRSLLKGAPWFKKGVCFSCQPGCARCCSGEPGYVWLSDAEVKALADFLGLGLERFEREHVRELGRGERSLTERANGDCVLLDKEGRGCSVYPVRPRQCRDYPFWPEIMSSRRRWERERKRCPGIDEGELHEAPEIIEALKSQLEE